MKTYNYADGMEGITLSEGMVRMDLFHYTGGSGSGRAAREVTQQLILPPAAFLRAFETMQRFVSQLESQGLVEHRETPPAPQAGSPNFS